MTIASAPHGHAENFAVLSAENRDGAKRGYGITMLESTRLETLRTIDLGSYPKPPRLRNSQIPNRLWVLARQKDSKNWDRIEYDTTTGAVLGRSPAGESKAIPGQRPLWFMEQPEQNAVVSLSFSDRNQSGANSWWLTSHGRSNGTINYSIEIGKGPIQRSQLNGDMLVLTLRRSPEARNQRFLAINLRFGKVVFDRNIKGNRRPDLVNSKDGRYLYLFTRKKVSGMARVGGNDYKTGVSGRMASVEVIDVANGRSVHSEKLGYSMATAQPHEEHSGLYVATMNSLTKGGITIWRLAENSVEPVRSSPTFCEPQLLQVSASGNAATVFCPNSVEHGPLRSGAFVFNERLRAPLGHVVATADHSAMFLGAPDASCVARMGLSPVELGDCVPTSKQRSKVTQTLLTAVPVVAMVALGSPYIFIPIPTYQAKSMLLNDSDSRLFVLNHTANDVTVFNAQTLENLGVADVDRRTDQLMRAPSSPWTLAVGPRSIAGFGMDATPKLELRDGRVAGMLVSQDRIFFASEKGLQVVALSSLTSTAVLPGLADAVQVISVSTDATGSVSPTAPTGKRGAAIIP